MAGGRNRAAAPPQRGGLPRPAGPPVLKEGEVPRRGVVKAVPGRAADRPASPRQAVTAVRAPQIADNVVKHACLRAIACGLTAGHPAITRMDDNRQNSIWE